MNFDQFEAVIRSEISVQANVQHDSQKWVGSGGMKPRTFRSGR